MIRTRLSMTWMLYLRRSICGRSGRNKSYLKNELISDTIVADMTNIVLIVSTSHIFWYQDPNFIILLMFVLSKVALNVLLNLHFFPQYAKISFAYCGHYKCKVEGDLFFSWNRWIYLGSLWNRCVRRLETMRVILVICSQIALIISISSITNLRFWGKIRLRRYENSKSRKTFSSESFCLRRRWRKKDRTGGNFPPCNWSWLLYA